MKKPITLRSFLLESVPHLKTNPDRLQLFIDRGTIKTRLQENLNFEYEYTLQCIVTDFASHPNVIIVPLLAWLKTNQTDFNKDALTFEADIIDHDKVDLSLSFPLSERVLVTLGDNNTYNAENLPEPEADYNAPDPAQFKDLYANNELLKP
jgi:hypothetical protein